MNNDIKKMNEFLASLSGDRVKKYLDHRRNNPGLQGKPYIQLCEIEVALKTIDISMQIKILEIIKGTAIEYGYFKSFAFFTIEDAMCSIYKISILGEVNDNNFKYSAETPEMEEYRAHIAATIVAKTGELFNHFQEETGDKNFVIMDTDKPLIDAATRDFNIIDRKEFKKIYTRNLQETFKLTPDVFEGGS